MSASPATLNDYLAEKRGAVLARDAQIDAGTAQATALRANVSAEGRSGVRRIRIREHQVISDSPPSFAGYNLGPSSPELQLGVLGSCVTHIFLIQAAAQQVPLTSLDVEVSGVIDPRAGKPGTRPRPSGHTTLPTPCISIRPRRVPTSMRCLPPWSGPARS